MKPAETQSHDDSVNADDKTRWRREVTEFLATFRSELDQLKTELEIEHEFHADRLKSTRQVAP